MKRLHENILFFQYTLYIVLTFFYGIIHYKKAMCFVNTKIMFRGTPIQVTLHRQTRQTRQTTFYYCHTSLHQIIFPFPCISQPSGPCWASHYWTRPKFVMVELGRAHVIALAPKCTFLIGYFTTLFRFGFGDTTPLHLYTSTFTLFKTNHSVCLQHTHTTCPPTNNTLFVVQSILPAKSKSPFLPEVTSNESSYPASLAIPEWRTVQGTTQTQKAPMKWTKRKTMVRQAARTSTVRGKW